MKWLRRTFRCRKGKHRDVTDDQPRGLNATREDGALMFRPRPYRYVHTCGDCGRRIATNKAAA